MSPDTTQYTEITSLDEDPIEVDDSPGPVGGNDPFPSESDQQLQDLREQTRQQLIALGSHRGKTRDDAHDKIDHLFDEWLPARIKATLGNHISKWGIELARRVDFSRRVVRRRR